MNANDVLPALQEDAPQPPAEAQPDEVVCLECGQPTMHMGQVCYACSHPAAKPAEAQAQGGGEVVAYGVYGKSAECPKPVLLPEYLGSMGVIRDRVLSKARREGFTGDFVERMAELGWWIEPLALASAPPSAPVGVSACSEIERAIQRARVFDDGSDGADAESAQSVVAILEGVLAQQPAAVDGDWRQKAAEWLEAKAVEQEANNQRWPDHAAAYKEWRDRPGVLRYLAAQVLAAQPGGSDNDR